MQKLPRDNKSLFSNLILSLYLPVFLLTLGQGIILPALPGFAADELGASIVLIGLVVSARDFGLMAFDIPAGILTSRLGTHRTMIIGVCFVILSGLIVSVSSEYWMLFVGRFLAGIGFALWSVSRFTYMAIALPVKVRGRVSSTFGGIVRASTVVGPIIGGFTSEFIDIRAPFYIQAGLAVLALILILSLRSKLTNDSQVSVVHSDHSILSGIKMLLQGDKRILLPATAVAVLLQFLRKVREIIPIWGNSIGLSESSIGIILSISSSLDFAMFPISGYTMDRFGRKFSVLPAFIFIAASMAVLGFAESFTTLLITTMLAGIGNGLTAGFLLTLSQDLAPSGSEKGSFIGIWRLITDTGGAASPPIITGIVQIFSPFTAAMSGVFIGITGAIIVTLFMRETLVRDKEKTDNT